ncbi:MAG: aconitase family protein [Anaerolineae bacterium]
MAPEYGATMGFFPVDDETLSFLPHRAFQGSDHAGRALQQGAGAVPHRRHPDPVFTDALELNLADRAAEHGRTKRPQDRVLLRDMKQTFEKALVTPVEQRGFALGEDALSRKCSCATTAAAPRSGHGVVVIAAIWLLLQ